MSSFSSFLYQICLLNGCGVAGPTTTCLSKTTEEIPADPRKFSSTFQVSWEMYEKRLLCLLTACVCACATGGDVQVAGVNEANLKIATQGGKLEVGKAKSGSIELHTEGQKF